MADYVRIRGLGLRPHIKTHKSLEMARKQIDSGAIGLTVATLNEARVMAKLQVELMLAYPALDRARALGVGELAKKAKLIVAVDSRLAVENLASAASSAGSELGILVDLDCGFGRTGVQTPKDALDIAQTVDRLQGVRLDGLFTFPGHISLQYSQQGAGLRYVDNILKSTLELWYRHGLEAKIVSGGSTPTAFQSHLVKSYTEIRPGTYIYNDRSCVVGGSCKAEDTAVKIIATVVSEAVPGKCVLDCGSKTLTQDLVMGDTNRGHGMIVEYPQADIVRLSEEHGEVDLSRCDYRPSLGERVQVIVNHICPAVNLHDFAWIVNEDASLQKLLVDARSGSCLQSDV
jgi:D-serine deaminase-like pyridoxal phosphate-dependent protein